MGLKIDETYEGVVGYAVVQQGKIAVAMAEQTTGRPWQNFAIKDKLKQVAAAKREPDLHSVFSRDSVNEIYVAARQKSDAKSQEIALAKLAGDFLAACERDKRMQWRSRIRIFAHAAARCAGNGVSSGPLRRNTVDYLERMFMKSREKDKKP